MKTKITKYTFVLTFIFLMLACSTRKDTFLSRNWHALGTKYNILYNGQIGLNKGLVGINAEGKDNYWQLLPVERMQIFDEFSADSKTKNTDFELAEAKATKAIQKHSMNIGGKEKNYQIDEAYLLLGKARYFDQRFVPALDAFNYILYKYPNSNKIYQAKIWREKANMHLGNDAQVVKNIIKLLKIKTLEKQIIADANALLSQAFLNLEEKDSAIVKLKIAEKFATTNSEKARYRFVLGQLYEELGQNENAVASFQSVIDMKRKAAKEYTIQAHAKKANLFDYKKGDTLVFLETYNKLIKDRENRPFLDVVFHQLGVFYDRKNQNKSAEEFYNLSLRKIPKDKYLTASNYRNIGNMHFENADYQMAAKYYDSTLVNLNSKTREYFRIQKTRKDLDDVIQYETIAKNNDSILSIVSMSESDKIYYYEKYIASLKKSDDAKKIALEKLKKTQSSSANTGSQEPSANLQDASGNAIKKISMAPPSINTGNQTANNFYFYNPTIVSLGILEFQKNWGKRSKEGNWRISSTLEKIKNDTVVASPDKTIASEKSTTEKVIDKYTSEYYIKQLPQKQSEIDSIIKERNFAYYQLGIIYKEKFKVYDLASNKLEKLLQQNPEEKLVLPTMYNLYKIYQINNASKAEEMKSKISSMYPNSRYAQIINNTTQTTVSENENSAKVYTKIYKEFQQEEFSSVLQQLEELITQYTGNEIVPKFELLKANTLGKLKGLEAYKTALQFAADNYPNSEEGKKAQDIITTEIPLLEGLAFTENDTKKWKIIYKFPVNDLKSKTAIEDKIKAFLAVETPKILSYSFDKYSEKDSFVTIHSVNSELYGNAIVIKLKEQFKLGDSGVVVSDENYRIIQIKKNLESYLATKKL
ncbi:tetratricopeptide repeat protein [Flavobacterium sp.]|uniref:type IX secretion system periplasmic lipoprotein PorW/SprE n=1 Tax=Flavobacterium sp. TaxID=239 RepID=UPI0038FC6A7B